MPLYTGLGDSGKTTLFGSNERKSKGDSIFDALGSIDGLNSYLGGVVWLCKTYPQTVEKSDLVSTQDILKMVQQDLFVLQALVGNGEVDGERNTAYRATLGKRLEDIENKIEELSAVVGPVDQFSVPGGSILSCGLHYARTLSRGTERDLVRAGGEGIGVMYLNRLSTLFFALALFHNVAEKIDEEHPHY